jgi:biopolymer transport protein ExbD
MSDMAVTQRSNVPGWIDRRFDSGGRRHPRRRRRKGGGVPIAVHFAPMIDVTFLLLIFFLVTTSFERAEGILASQMPRDSGAPTVALPLSPIVVRLVQTGAGHDDFSIGIDQVERTPRSFAELTDTLRAIHERPAFDTETPVVIVAGDDVRWDHVVGYWNAALRAGCERIAFGEP